MGEGNGRTAEEKRGKGRGEACIILMGGNVLIVLHHAAECAGSLRCRDADDEVEGDR